MPGERAALLILHGDLAQLGQHVDHPDQDRDMAVRRLADLVEGSIERSLRTWSGW